MEGMLSIDDQCLPSPTIRTRCPPNVSSRRKGGDEEDRLEEKGAEGHG